MIISKVTKPETSKSAETGATTAAADNTKSATENGEAAATPADDKKKRGTKRKVDTPSSGKEVDDDKKIKQVGAIRSKLSYNIKVTLSSRHHVFSQPIPQSVSVYEHQN